MYPSHSFPTLVKNDALPFVIENEKQVAAARAAVDAIAKDNAVLRLIETAKVIRDSMSVADQRSLHARLRSDIESLIQFFPGSQS